MFFQVTGFGRGLPLPRGIPAGFTNRAEDETGEAAGVFQWTAVTVKQLRRDHRLEDVPSKIEKDENQNEQ